MEYKIGQTVIVMDEGYTYTTYREWAAKHGMERWVEVDFRHPKEGESYKVIAVGVHESDENTQMIGIEDEDGNQFIIDVVGVKVVERTLPEGDFIVNHHGTKYLLEKVEGGYNAFYQPKRDGETPVFNRMDRVEAYVEAGTWEISPEPAPTRIEFELFDRVVLEGSRYIVVTDKSGNKMLLSEHKGFAHVGDIDPDAALSVYDRPAYPNDLFDFSEVGELKYVSAKMKRRNVLTDRLIELQNELTEINEELSALN